MKKFFTILWIILYVALSCIRLLSPPVPAPPAFAEPTANERITVEERYACILTDDVYFYTSAEANSGVFTLPKSYYVKVLSYAEPFTKVEYLTDGEYTQRLQGYCKTEQLTFVDYIPVNPYLYATFEVIYTAQDGWTDDELIGKIEVTCGYYGSYSIGSKQYAYVLQNGKYTYVPMPEDFTYPENTEYTERHSDGAEEQATGGALRIGILVVLCLLVPILATIILQRSSHPLYTPEE